MLSSVLASLPLFTDLSTAEIESASAAMRRRRYAKGKLIHNSGAMGADFYIVESGRVTIQLPSEGGVELTLRLLGPGDFFGEISLLAPASLHRYMHPRWWLKQPHGPQ